MTLVSSFYRRYGAWIFVLGLFTALLGFAYRTGVWGLVAVILGLVAALSDPAVIVFAGRREKQRPESSILIGWALAIAGFLTYVGRSYMDISPDRLGGEDSLLGRARLLLLALFLLMLTAGFAFRLAVALGNTAVEGLRAGGSSRAHYLRGAVFSIIAAIPLFILINYVGAVRNPTLDLSPGYYSFGEASRSIIKTLDRNVQVYAFLPVQQAVRESRKNTQPELFKIAEDVRVMLEQLPVANSRINIQFLNADLDSDRAADFGTVTNGTVVFRVLKPAEAVISGEKPYIERRIYVYNEQDMERLERESVRALVQVSSPEKILYFTASNGERFSYTEKANEPGGMETLKNMLRFYNFQLKGLDHNTAWPGPIPDDAAAVVAAGPTTSFGPEARRAILEYLKKGGRLFLAVDPDGDEDFAWVLREFPGNTFFFRKAFLSHIANLPGVVVSDNVQKHRITENLSIAGRSIVVFPSSGYFDEGKPSTDFKKDGVLAGLSSTAFLHTPYNTVIDTNKNGKKDGAEAAGRYALGLAIEKPVKEEPKAEPKAGSNEKKPPDAKGGEKSPKVALYSGVGWLTEFGLRFPVDQRNIILAADTLFWLTESQLAAALVPEKRESRSIQVTDELKVRNMVLGMLVFPAGTALALALVIALYRRRRRFIGDE